MQHLSSWTLVSGLLLLSGCASNPLRQIDFQKINLPKTPNYYLVCPTDFCNVKPNAISLTYNVSIEKLNQAWQEVIHQQPRTELVAENSKDYQYTYIQRSRLFRFPDTINVKLISISSLQSTIAIYSRSKYGYSDMGVNRKRVELWLKELQKHLEDLN